MVRENSVHGVRQRRAQGSGESHRPIAGRAGACARRVGYASALWVWAAALGCGGGAGSAPDRSDTQTPLDGIGPAQPARTTPVPERPVWVEPEGGVRVDSVPLGSDLRLVDAFGNLWFTGCEGLFIANPSSVRRYRYLDSAWELGGDPITADRQGRVWYGSPRRLAMLERGEWRDVWDGDWYQFVVGEDGVAWVVAHESPSSWGYTLSSVWPEATAPITAPRWIDHVFAGRGGALWFVTHLSDGSNALHHFDGQQFSSPYNIEFGQFLYDPLDDTVVISRHVGEDMIKVRFDGVAIVDVSRVPIEEDGALIRTSDGRLVAPTGGGDRALSNGKVDFPLPFRDGELKRSLLSPMGELYFETQTAVLHQTGGDLEPVLELSELVPEIQPWEVSGYAAALRAPSTRAGVADFEPTIPAIFGQKVSLRGVPYYTGFETPQLLAVDGEDPGVSVGIAPEFRAFATEQGLPLEAPRKLGFPVFPEGAEQLDLSGYLVPGPCYAPRDKPFHLLEAYPESLPSTERAALEAALRARYPL